MSIVEKKLDLGEGSIGWALDCKSSLKKYSSYKDSGIDWLGDIPEHWELDRLKHIFKEKKKVLNFSLPAGSISFGEVVFKDDEKIPESTKATYQEVLKGDYLINPLNLNYDLISLRIALSNIDVVVSSGYIVIQGVKQLERNYYKWLLHQYDVSYMKLLGSGVRQTISFNHIANSELPFPPLPEQEAIANFLDDKCEKIDSAVGLKEQQIEKLKELRQITIHNAVTTGIPRHAEPVKASPKMKDSGIDWIGEIPEHWEVKCLKHLSSKIGSGVTPSGGGSTYLNNGIPLLRSQNILFDKIELSNVAYISQKVHDEMTNSKVKKHDVLLNITGGSIGRCNVNRLEIEMNVNQHVCIIRPHNINHFYLNYLISSEVGQAQIWYYQQGGGREGLNFQNLKNFRLPIPPLSEQQAIVTYLEEQTSKIEKAIAQKQEQIVKLKEYKQSLINEVVTGKVKVTA